MRPSPVVFEMAGFDVKFCAFLSTPTCRRFGQSGAKAPHSKEKHNAPPIISNEGVALVVFPSRGDAGTLFGRDRAGRKTSPKEKLSVKIRVQRSV
jgi:hypothetical protein